MTHRDTPLVTMRPGYEIKTSIINFDPQRPVAHAVLRRVLELDEEIVDRDTVIA